MPPWASHHVMLEVAGHTGQTTFPNTRLQDRPASPTFIFSSGFKKAIPKKSTRLIQISENQKHKTNPHCPHRPFGPPSVVSLGTSYAHVALVWCIWAPYTTRPPGFRNEDFWSSSERNHPTVTIYRTECRPILVRIQITKSFPSIWKWVPLRSFSFNKTPCLEVSGHKNSTETKHLGPHELSSIATKSRGVSEFFCSDPTPKWNEENVQTIWLFHLKVCHSVVEFNMGHGSSLPIQSQVSIHFLSSYMYTRQVKVRKWNQVGQCSYTIKVVDSEILPHPITPPWPCWVETHSKMHAFISTFQTDVMKHRICLAETC